MSYNRVILVGNLGKDPLDLSKGDTTIAAFSVATHETVAFNGKTQKTTEWFDVVCFGKDADFVIRNLKKGNEVLVEGRLQARTYTTKDSTKVKTFEIKANTVQGLSRGSRAKQEEDAVVDHITEKNSSRLEHAVRTTLPKASGTPRGASMLGAAIGEEESESLQD